MNIHCKYDELMPVHKLKPHPKNRNKHPDDQIERLAKILKYQGIRAPIVVSNRSNRIVKGHGTLMAIKANQWDTAPIVYQDFDDDDQEWLFVQSDNAIANWAELDIKGINADLSELGPFDIDLLGIKDFTVTPEEKELGDEEATPEVRETDIKLGDLFLLGDHRLLCGDSTDKAQVEKLMNGEKADMVFTDPPYGVSVKNTQGNIIGDEDLTVFKNSLPLLKSYAKLNAHFYVWCASGDRLPESIESFASIFQFQNLLPIRCTHENKRGRKAAFKLNYETCLFANDNTRPFNFSKKFKVSETTINDSRYNGDGNLRVYPALWDGERSTEHNMNIVHPTQKKVEMIEFYLEISSNNSELVMDLFGGSGSTLIACEKTNRKCFMMELDPQYCQVIIDRWEKYTGKKAVKHG